ncbi:IS110 family transposase [Corynebacterium diphtheriae]|nr:IS110 family transposase [Corynebacterium diphtheriae]
MKFSPALKMLSGFDDDIARDCTRTINRLRSVLTQIYPSLERVFAGSTLICTPVFDLLIHYKGPQGQKRAGYHRVLNWMVKHTRKDPTALLDAIFAALKAQTATVLGSDAAELVIPQLAANIKALKDQRGTIAEQVESMLDDLPLLRGLDKHAWGRHQDRKQILLTIGDGSDFDSAGHLAAYAGIAPVTRPSGSSIRGEFPARSGNKRLKKRFVLLSIRGNL